MFPMRTNVNVSNVWQIFAHPLNLIIFFAERLCRNRKTSLVGAFVNALEQMGQKCVLMAPTGRAAKVFHNYSGQKLFQSTKIYRQKSATEFQFNLSENLHKNTFL